MNKKIIISILLITTIFIITGCTKENKENKTITKNKNSITCIKKGIEKKDSDGNSYTVEVIQEAKVDDDNKLTYYSSKSTYDMKSKEVCEKSCEVATKWNDDINAKNYSGTHRTTTCKCDENKYIDEHIYDDIPNLDKFVRSDIDNLKDDNTFDLEEFKNHYEKYEYNCS